MTTVTLRPDATINAPASVTQGSAPGATAHQVTADESDSSYFTINSSDSICIVGFDDVSPPAGFRSKSVQVSVRGQGPGQAAMDLFGLPGGSIVPVIPLHVFTWGGSFSTQTTAVVSTPELSESALDELRLSLSGVHAGGYPTLDISRIAVDWTYVERPVCSIDTISSPITDSSYLDASITPTLDPDGGPLTHQRWWVTDDNNGYWYDTGVIASSLTARRIGPFPSGDYTLHVQCGQMVNGEIFWSAVDTEQFTINVDPVVIDAIVSYPDDNHGYIELEVERDAGGPAWDLVEVERLEPAGWVPVRGATLVDPGDAAMFTVIDYEASNGVPYHYRARAVRYVNGEPVFGDWTQTAIERKWESDDVWLKVPGRPGLNTKVCMRVIPSPTYGREMGVFTPANGNRPIVVVGPQQATASGQFVIQTETDGEAAAVHAALAEPVKLLQGPPGWHRWGSRYVMTGPVTEQPLAETVNARMWTLTEPAGWSTNYVEVDRPADPDAGEV